MRVVVVGGSASNVGKTCLAAHLLRRDTVRRKLAMKVSVREQPCEMRVVVVTAAAATDHRRDGGRLLAAGATHVVWVTVQRASVRDGLAAGLRAARALRPATLVIESTSAGIELRRIDESWFVAGAGPWKPWADRHRVRADHVITSGDVERLLGTPREGAA